MSRLENKVAFITGGTSGIGKATVYRLISEGAKVLFTGRNDAAGKAIAKETGSHFIHHDVTDSKGYKKISEIVKTQYERLDIAFANAGTEMGDTDIENINIEILIKHVSIN